MQTQTTRPKAKPARPGCLRYFDDESSQVRDGLLVESNGDLRLIRDEETGQELYRFRWELM